MTFIANRHLLPFAVRAAHRRPRPQARRHQSRERVRRRGTATGSIGLVDTDECEWHGQTWIVVLHIRARALTDCGFEFHFISAKYRTYLQRLVDAVRYKFTLLIACSRASCTSVESERETTAARRSSAPHLLYCQWLVYECRRLLHPPEARHLGLVGALLPLLLGF